ncbi:MAG: hypothetical protein HC882_07390 [Acidobacteria bacterium]|nr:hypothetical protein [Acidobacteriota bacterium]
MTVVIDATDNFQTRYLLNDVCVKHSIPLIYGGVVGTMGMTMTIIVQADPTIASEQRSRRSSRRTPASKDVPAWAVPTTAPKEP